MKKKKQEKKKEKNNNNNNKKKKKKKKKKEKTQKKKCKKKKKKEEKKKLFVLFIICSQIQKSLSSFYILFQSRICFCGFSRRFVPHTKSKICHNTEKYSFLSVLQNSTLWCGRRIHFMAYL